MHNSFVSASNAKSSSTWTAFFDDPRYDEEKWVFDMINIIPVWELGYFGSGIRVRINDNGVQADHPEFENRFDWGASCEENVEPSDNSDYHGTAVASIVAASGDNGECAVGIAPKASLSACNALTPSESFLGYKVDAMDISQNSYDRPACNPARRNLQNDTAECPFTFEDHRTNPCQVCDFSMPTRSNECESAIVSHCKRHFENDALGCSEFLDIIVGGLCSYNSLTETARLSITKGILEGREGKGVIYLFASGNAYTKGDTTAIKGYTNTRFTISVGAVGKDKLHASYSTPGASIFVSAPGGDFETSRNHVTALNGGKCGFPGVGTSFACPVVSGVVALILEANPDLTWRDVQGILAETSQPVPGDSRDPSAVINGVGLWHSNLYGFGIVDAEAAVAAAGSWHLFGPEQMLVAESGQIDLPIADDPTMSLTSTVLVDQDFVVESVAVYLDVQHFSRGDLELVLTSPQGTQSVLHPGKLPETTQLDEEDRWKLLTIRNWGEPASGDWSLTITDVKAGHIGECVDASFLVVYTGVSVTCDYLVQYEMCKLGGLDEDFFASGAFDSLLQAEDNGSTMEAACCACGGGILRSDYGDKLRQWRLVIYGREPQDEAASPSRVASAIPSVVLSAVPVVSMTDTPSTVKPRERSSSNSPVPSIVPSSDQSTVLSLFPSIVVVPSAMTETPSTIEPRERSSSETPGPSQSYTFSPAASQMPTQFRVLPSSSSPSSGGIPSASSATSYVPTIFEEHIASPSSKPSHPHSNIPSMHPTGVSRRDDNIIPTQIRDKSESNSPTFSPTQIPNSGDPNSYNHSSEPTIISSSLPTQWPTKMDASPSERSVGPSVRWIFNPPARNSEEPTVDPSMVPSEVFMATTKPAAKFSEHPSSSTKPSAADIERVRVDDPSIKPSSLPTRPFTENPTTENLQSLSAKPSGWPPSRFPGASPTEAPDAISPSGPPTNTVAIEDEIAHDDASTVSGTSPTKPSIYFPPNEYDGTSSSHSLASGWVVCGIFASSLVFSY